jgi:hypothetical protein
MKYLLRVIVVVLCYYDIKFVVEIVVVTLNYGAFFSVNAKNNMFILIFYSSISSNSSNVFWLF